MSLIRPPRRTPRHPYPPRPAHPPLAEPTIDWRIRTAVALFGAERLLKAPRMQKRLLLSGLDWEDVAPVLARIRSIDGWAREFDSAADRLEKEGDFRRATSLAFLGQIVLSPYHPEKNLISERMRRCHQKERSKRPDICFERRELVGGALVGYRETPKTGEAQTKPTVLLLPPLASTKEELTLLSDPFLAAGYPIIRIDLPGQGESPAPLLLDAERLLIQALDEWDVPENPGVIAGGISLGAYFALRLAGSDSKRVRAVFGVSPPAIVTPEQWAKQHEIIWQYLDRYFGTETRAETLRLGMSLHLDDLLDSLTLPIRLYHAASDFVSLPDAPERYRTALAHATLTDRILPDTHGCLMHLRETIAPELLEWHASLPIIV